MYMIVLTKTQLNPLLLDPIYDFLRDLFKSDTYFSQHSNNENEMISPRHQGEVLSAIKGDLCKIILSLGSDDSRLRY